MSIAAEGQKTCRLLYPPAFNSSGTIAEKFLQLGRKMAVSFDLFCILTSAPSSRNKKKDLKENLGKDESDPKLRFMLLFLDHCIKIETTVFQIIMSQTDEISHSATESDNRLTWDIIIYPLRLRAAQPVRH